MLPQFPLISVGVLQKCKRIIINAVFPRLRNINITIPNILGKLEDGETCNIQCSEVHSRRFLSIYLDHNGILSLCEVQVFGCKWSLRNELHFWLIKGTKFEVILMSFGLQPLLLPIDFAASLFENLQWCSFCRSHEFVHQGIPRPKGRYESKWHHSGSNFGQDWNSVRRLCAQRDGCTQFSYYGNALGNNCLLGSPTSGKKDQDGWITYSVWSKWRSICIY